MKIDNIHLSHELVIHSCVIVIFWFIYEFNVDMINVIIM